MHWLEASVRVPRHLVSQAESLMESQGALAVTLSDDGDCPILEPGVGETPMWQGVRVAGLFPGETPRAKLVSVLSLVPGIEPGGRVRLAKVADRAWERAWMENLGPMRFGNRLWIVPSGHEAPDTAGDIVRLDPGLAFGTGTHATTRLCLEWIDAHDFAGLTVVDYGCGSGVLGIAAALKGAARVVSVDNDPQALEATALNAQRNRVTERIETVQAGRFSSPEADVVLANILAGTLVQLAPVLCGTVKPGGSVVLSGILPEQSAEVAGAYAGRAIDLETIILGGWAMVTGTVADRGE